MVEKRQAAHAVSQQKAVDKKARFVEWVEQRIEERDRNHAIFDMIIFGCTYASVGRHYKIGGGRVSQIFARAVRQRNRFGLGWQWWSTEMQDRMRGWV